MKLKVFNIYTLFYRGEEIYLHPRTVLSTLHLSENATFVVRVRVLMLKEADPQQNAPPLAAPAACKCGCGVGVFCGLILSFKNVFFLFFFVIIIIIIRCVLVRV